METKCAPCWHAAHIQGALAFLAGAATGSRRMVLVGYSGAGPLLPGIATAMAQRPTACSFLDAGIPRDGASRLDLVAEEISRAFARRLRAALMRGESQPRWTDAQLGPLVREGAIRAELLAGLRPRPLSFFEEPIPVPAGWLEVPCGFLRLSAGYDLPAARALALGWPVARIAGTHFSGTTEPVLVAAELIALRGAIVMGIAR